MSGKNRLASLALLLVAIIWGSGFIATEYALQSGLSVPFIMALRFWVGALILLPFFHRRVRAAGRKTALRGAVAGVLLFGAFYSQTVGQTMTLVSNTAFLTATNVVMVPFLLWALQRRRPQARVFALAALTLLGIGLLTLTGREEAFTLRAGDLIVLLCALLFALHIVYLGVYCRDDDPVAVTFWQLLASGVLALAVFLLLTARQVPRAQLAAGILPVLYLAVFSTCLCYLLQTWAQTRVAPARAGILLSTEGLFGSLFSVALGLEPLRAGLVLGGLLITGSVVLMEVGPGSRAEGTRHRQASQ